MQRPRTQSRSWNHFSILGHTAPDDYSALDRIAAVASDTAARHVRRRRRRRTRPKDVSRWLADRGTATRMSPGEPLARDNDARRSGDRPAEAGEPIRYCGEVIGAIAMRWTAGVSVDAHKSRVDCTRRIARACSQRSRAHRSLAHTSGCTVLRRPARRKRASASVARIDHQSRAGTISGADRRRERQRQGTGRARHSSPRAATRPPVLRTQLRRASRTIWSRRSSSATRAARSPARSANAPGCSRRRDGGTLFLDEIGELSPRAQAKLLRVLQEGELRRVGENLSRRVDVRIVAATNRDLEAGSRRPAGSGGPAVPARRRADRRAAAARAREDIPLLAEHFWREAAGAGRQRAPRCRRDAVAALARYDWPGNVRELQNVLALRSPCRRLDAAGSRQAALAAARGSGCRAARTRRFDAAREAFERRFVARRAGTRRRSAGRAAQELGVTRQGLAKMMRRLGIECRRQLSAWPSAS